MEKYSKYLNSFHILIKLKSTNSISGHTFNAIMENLRQSMKHLRKKNISFVPNRLVPTSKHSREKSTQWTQILCRIIFKRQPFCLEIFTKYLFCRRISKMSINSAFGSFFDSSKINIYVSCWSPIVWYTIGYGEVPRFAKENSKCSVVIGKDTNKREKKRRNE